MEAATKADYRSALGQSFTPFHAKYFAYELTKRCASDSAEKLAAALVCKRRRENPSVKRPDRPVAPE